MLTKVRDQIRKDLDEALAEEELELEPRIEINEHDEKEKGDLASPVAFEAASEIGVPPQEVAQTIASHHEIPDIVEELSVDQGYINYHLDDDSYVSKTLEGVLSEGEAYGTGEDGETIVEDVSSPNIARHLHIGHLRNTVMGDALGNILEARGHEVIRDNHLGDWGGQFGNLMYAFMANKSGEDPHDIFDEKEVETDFDENPIDHLLELYQAFGQKEARYQDDSEELGRIEEDYGFEFDDEIDLIESELEDLRERGRNWFEKLEDGDEDAEELWEEFKEVSLERFRQEYDRLGVEFDEWIGESFYVQNGLTDEVVEELLDEGIANQKSDGSVAVDLIDDEGEINEFVILTSDGTTLYPTRDLAAIKYRDEKFDSDRDIYVVASEQEEYFQNLFEAADLMGYDQDDLVHVSYGMISLPEGSMSTRRGQIITAKEVLDTAYEEARGIVEEKRPELSEEKADEVAEKVALGAVKFENVNVGREKDITFDMDRATSFNEASGPYIQYSATRANSILDEAEEVSVPGDPEFDDLDLGLGKKISRYPLALEASEESWDPSPLANYLLDLASEFNSFYAENQVLDSDYEEERLALTGATNQVFENGLGLLGIETLEEM